MSTRADWTPWSVTLTGDGYEIHERQHLIDARGGLRVALRVWADGAVRVTSQGRGYERAWAHLCMGLIPRGAQTIWPRAVDDLADDGLCDPVPE